MAADLLSDDIQKLGWQLEKRRDRWDYRQQGCVRATAVGQDAERNAERNAVLAGDPKGLDYYVILL